MEDGIRMWSSQNHTHTHINLHINPVAIQGPALQLHVWASVALGNDLTDSRTNAIHPAEGSHRYARAHLHRGLTC